MYQLGYYLESRPGVIYPSFVQAACARFGNDAIHVFQNVRGHFSRRFDTVDDLVGDILYNAHRSVSFQGFLHTDKTHDDNRPFFTTADPTVPVQWILDNAYRLEFSDVSSVSTPQVCRYTIYGAFDNENEQEWALELEVKYS